jgi:hypothetical protein
MGLIRASSGSSLMDRIIEAAMEWIPEDVERHEFYRAVIRAFEDHDWDSPGECLGTDDMWDGALMSLHPDLYDEEE